MRATPTPRSRTRALIGLALLVGVLLFLLALIEGPDAKLGCSPLAPISANTVDPPTLEPPPIELDDPGSSTQAIPQHEPAALPVRHTLRGRVLDEATDQPVPWVFVHINSSAGNRSVGTQADGSFTTDLSVEDGQIDAQVTDDEQTVGSAHIPALLANSENGWTIRVPIGPTYPVLEIDGAAPRASASWRFHLVESQNPIGTAGTIRVTADGLAAQNKGELRDWGWRTLRNDGDRPFVRWPKAAFAPSQEWFPSLTVRSEPTSAKAQVSVYGTVGIQPGLSIPTTPFALLIGSVAVPLDVPPAGTRVVVHDVIADDKHTFDEVPFFAEIETKEDGAYAFEVPSSLTYTLCAWRRGLTMMDAQAVVHRGRTFGPDLELFAPSQPITRAMATVRFDLPKSRFSALVRIVPAPVSSFTDAHLFEAYRGELELTALAIGSYRVDSIGVDEPAPLNSVRTHQDMPTTELDPPPSDTQPPSIHRIDARSGSTGERCLVTAGPAGSMFTTSKRGSTYSWLVSPDNPAVFTVWSRNCAPAMITEDRFVKRDDALVATMVLGPGWGTLLAFRDGDPEDKKSMRGQRNPPGNMTATDALGFRVPPLPGVRVHYRGVKLGTSDRDGCLFLSHSVRPEQLTLVAAGWHMTSISRMPGDGSRWWVWMSRDP